jgi:hypothetical protein
MIDFNAPQVQAALVALLGVAVSSAIALRIALRNLHKDARSRSRQEWIVELRGTVARLLARLDAYSEAKLRGTDVERRAIQAELALLKHQIALLLNVNKEPHAALLNLTSELCKRTNSTGVEYDHAEDRDRLVVVTRQVIDTEWNKAKNGK